MERLLLKNDCLKASISLSCSRKDIFCSPFELNLVSVWLVGLGRAFPTFSFGFYDDFQKQCP